MSIRAIQSVMDHSHLKGSRRLLLMVLADAAREEDFRAWPAVPTLARQTCMSIRWVNMMLADIADTVDIAQEKQLRGEPLAELIIVPGNGRNHTNSYYINLPGAAAGPLTIHEGDVIFLEAETLNGGSGNRKRETLKPAPKTLKPAPKTLKPASDDPLRTVNRSISDPLDNAQKDLRTSTRPRYFKPECGAMLILWEKFAEITGSEPETQTAIRGWVAGLAELTKAECTPQEIALIQVKARKEQQSLTPFYAAKHLHEVRKKNQSLLFPTRPTGQEYDDLYEEADEATEPIESPPVAQPPPGEPILRGHNVACRCAKCEAVRTIRRHPMHCTCPDCVRYGYYKQPAPVVMVPA